VTELEHDERRMEVEVHRIGGADVVEGVRFPRYFGPAVHVIRLTGGWNHSVYLDSADGSSLVVALEGMWPATPPGFQRGMVRLESANGVRLGNAEAFMFWTSPNADPLHTLVSATLVYEAVPVHLGLFSVALRVPLEEEYRGPQVPEFKEVEA
jgi:hypothetical protein